MCVGSLLSLFDDFYVFCITCSSIVSALSFIEFGIEFNIILEVVLIPFSVRARNLQQLRKHMCL